jgi:REP element-mobilizing transposase RayT
MPNKRRAEKRSAFRHLWLPRHRAYPHGPPRFSPHPPRINLFRHVKNVDTFPQCPTIAATAFREERTIRDERDYSAHMDYVHFNPVKHGLVTHPAEWPYSKFHKYVALGLYDAAWSKPGYTITPSGMGERP